MQTNFFRRPKSGYSGSGNEQEHELGFAATETFAVYSIKWTSDGISWYVNGEHVRSIPDEANGKFYYFPDPNASRMRLAANAWPVDQTMDSRWAGRVPSDFYDSSAYIDWIQHTDGSECVIDSVAVADLSTETRCAQWF